MKRIVVLAVAVLALAGCSEGDDGPVDSDSVKGSIEELDGRTYHCFRYTTMKRGGLWCQEVTG